MPAANQLANIFDRIAEDNHAAAERTVRRIREAIRRTSGMPYSARVGRVADTREIAVVGTPYLVAYRIVEKTIHVLAVLHGAQDWPGTF
jgi:plasmid stabilization system protein ParE